MKVLLLTPHYPPEVRSVSVLMSQLAEDLSTAGYKVTVVAPCPPGNMRGTAVDALADLDSSRSSGAALGSSDGGRARVVRVSVLPFVKVAPSVRAVTQFTLAASMVWAGLREGRHDAILVYSPPLPLVLAAEALGRRWRAPFVVNVQDVYPQALIDLGLARSRVVIGVLTWLERRAYLHSSAITVHSQGNRDLLVARGIPPEKITVVHNWVDTPSVAPAPQDNPYRRSWGLDGRFVALFAGVMGYAQDLSVIVEAAGALRTESDIVFLLVGDGVQRRETEERARALGLENVRFLPFQPLDRYEMLVAAADCCLATLQPAVTTPVVPSKIAGFMAAGRPVIAALPSGDARRLVEESGGGICVGTGDAPALAASILRLARDPAARRAMGEAGRRYVAAHFSRNAATERYVGLVRDLIRRHAGGTEPGRPRPVD
jgi:colanic acid biosynthesis glycosyl transferase WcaI